MLRKGIKPKFTFASTNPQDIHKVTSMGKWMCNKAPIRIAGAGTPAAFVMTKDARKKYGDDGPITYAIIKKIRSYKDNDDKKFRDTNWTDDREYNYLIEIAQDSNGLPITEYYPEITDEEISKLTVNSRGYGEVS